MTLALIIIAGVLLALTVILGVTLHKEMTKFKCRHKWTEVGRCFYPPVNRGFHSRGFVPEDLINRLVFGYTVVRLKCDHCGEVGVNTLVGDHKGW